MGENAKRSSATKTVRFCGGRGLRWEGGRVVFIFTGHREEKISAKPRRFKVFAVEKSTKWASATRLP